MNLNRFQLGKFVDGETAQLAAKAAFFVSAERELGVTIHKGIDPDRAGADTASESKCDIDIPGPDTG